MRNLKKKLLSVLLALIFSLSAIVLMSGTVYAVNETEDNNSESKATAIAVNTTVNGKLTNYDDDYFSFKVPENGYVYLSFSHPTTTNTANFANVSLTGYTNVVTRCDIGSASTIKIGLTAGTYYVLVDEYDGYDQLGDNATYSLTVNYTKASDWETEHNNSKGEADIISTGKTYYGTLLNYDDDYYSFSIPNDGYVSIDFKHNTKVNTANFANVSLVDYSNVVARCDFDSASTIKIGLLAGTYYVLVDEYDGYDQL